MSRVAAALLLLVLAACGGDAGSKDPGAGQSAGRPTPGVIGEAASGEPDGWGTGSAPSGTILGGAASGEPIGSGEGAPSPGLPAPAYSCDAACAKVRDCFGAGEVSATCISDCEVELTGSNANIQAACIECVVDESCSAIADRACDADCSG